MEDGGARGGGLRACTCERQLAEPVFCLSVIDYLLSIGYMLLVNHLVLQSANSYCKTLISNA